MNSIEVGNNWCNILCGNNIKFYHILSHVFMDLNDRVKWQNIIDNDIHITYWIHICYVFKNIYFFLKIDLDALVSHLHLFNINFIFHIIDLSTFVK